jgi:hypothetical protein
VSSWAGSVPQPHILMRLVGAVSILERQHRERVEHERKVLQAVRLRCKMEGTRAFARRAHVDHGNLVAMLAGRRRLSMKMRTKLEVALL